MALRVAIVSVDGVAKALPPGDTLDGAGGAWNSSSGITSLATPTDRVGIGTAVPSTKAKLQVDSTTQGFLPPRMTTTQRDAIASPPAGLEIYNTSTNEMQAYNGANWVANSTVISGGSSGTSSDNSTELSSFLYNEVYG